MLHDLWPVAAGIVGVGGYVYGTLKGYWKLQQQSTANKDAAASAAGKAAQAQEKAEKAHDLIAALAQRVVALETRQADILEHVRFIRDNMLMDPVRVRYARKRDKERGRDDAE